MNVMTRRALTCVIVAASPFALSSSASASDVLPVTFWVEPSSAACADVASITARDLVLACEAAHAGCSVSETKEAASRVLVVRCQADAPAGETASITSSDELGERWRVNLAAEEDQPRSAALYAVRRETTNAISPVLPEPVSPYAWRREDAPRVAPAPTTGTPTAKILMFGGLGVALVAGAVGTITAAQAMHEEERLASVCPAKTCPPSVADELADMRTLTTVSTVSFVAAGAGLVTSLVGLVLWKGSEPSSSVRATAGAGWAGLAGAF